MINLNDFIDNLIVIEGSDGSGKTVQTALLADAINRQMGKGFAKILNFPDYDSQTGQLVQSMLTGKYGGDAKDLNPYFTSPMYSIDRYQYFQKLKNENDHIHIAICNRYTMSNLIHQGARISDTNDFISYWNWLYDFEFNKLGLPKPNTVIYLWLPSSVSVSNINRRNKETNRIIDINETEEYLSLVEENVNRIRGITDWDFIYCTDFNEETHMLSPMRIHSSIIDLLKRTNLDMKSVLFNYNP